MYVLDALNCRVPPGRLVRRGTYAPASPAAPLGSVMDVVDASEGGSESDQGRSTKICVEQFSYRLDPRRPEQTKLMSCDDLWMFRRWVRGGATSEVSENLRGGMVSCEGRFKTEAIAARSRQAGSGRACECATPVAARQSRRMRSRRTAQAGQSLTG